MASVEITGIDSILRMVDRGRFDATVQKTLHSSASVWRDETKKMPPVSAKATGYSAIGIPVDSSRMRNSIRTRSIAAGIIAPVNYSGFVHDGTGRVPARPFLQWSWDLYVGNRLVILWTDALTRMLNGR